MTTFTLGALAVVAAYLIGAIPFGYVLVRAISGVDVRTIGSGNTGATNASRVLGARFFPVIFVLDAAKGFLPTFFLPRLVAHWTGSAVLDLPPLVALATILGHNFPVYLGFKGGKGAATSFGAVLALDPIATVFAAFGAVIFLAFTRFVSMASLGGGLVFVLVHFARTPEPLGAGQRTTSALILALMVLLIVRHRTNLARIAAGTEPKVSLRRKRAPEGKVRGGLVALIVVIAAGTGLVVHASRRPALTAAGRHFVEVSRYAPGHQRAERLAFLDGGKLLVATCPRYLRVVLTRVTDAREVEEVKDIDVEGRPVAIAAANDHFTVLVRPHGDARHLEEAWWQSFDLAGDAIGSRVRVGWDPDDFAFSEDGTLAYVLTSGSAEGETNRPSPALIVFDVADGTAKPIGRVAFDHANDDPERLTLLPGGRAAVSLRGSNDIAQLDVSDPRSLRIIDRVAVPDDGVPLALAVGGDGRLLVGDPDASAFWRLDGDRLVRVDVDGGVADLVEAEGFTFATLPRGSGVAVFEGRADFPLGKLSIRGAANLGNTRPLGIAYSPARKLLAVSNRAGGSLHLIAIE